MSAEQKSLEVIAPDEGMSASSSGNPGQITQTIKKAIATGHYLGPTTTCPTLPPGCEVAFSAIKIDPERETYDIPGRAGRGITKTGLNRISKGIGVSWDSRLSHRVDKGEDSFLAVYKAVGHYRDFDGTMLTIEAEKQMDLRDGSEAARTMKPGELAIQRKFIAEHAQTKAQLRAIRSGLGIEIAYPKEFFNEPFICARLIFTARSDNAATQAIFDNAVARMFLGGVEALYGQGTPQPLATQSPEMRELTEPTESSTESQAAECAPGKCLGMQSPRHFDFCFAPAKSEMPKQAEDWTIPLAFPDVAGTKLTDLSDSKLSTMVGACDLVCENKEWADKHAEYRGYHGHLHTEALRREALKKQQDQY